MTRVHPNLAPNLAPSRVFRLACGLSLWLGLGLSSARANDVDADAAQALQQSYDREGAGKLAESLSSLDSLPPG